MSIEHDSNTPLYQQIAEDIKEKIASGAMPPGSRIQPFRELAGVYGVSVMTINKALSGLISEGVLSSRVGKGTFVAEKKSGIPEGRKHLIGFVLRDLTSPFFLEVVRGAEQEAAVRGYRILFSHSANDRQKEDDQIRFFMGLGVDGLIIASMSRTYVATSVVRELHEARFPYCMVSYTHDEDIYMITMDSEKAGYLAADHLIRTGRTRIGYINDSKSSIAGGLRKKGYIRALSEHGLEVPTQFEYYFPYEGEWNDYKSGYEVGVRIAGLEDRPDAMFVFDDMAAIGLQDALLDRGLRVPGDIAVVGVGDIEQSRRARVPLTTVHQARAETGRLAVDRILRRLEGDAAVEHRTLLEPYLVVRESTSMLERKTAAVVTVSAIS